MVCPRCGREIAETEVICGFCGSSLSQSKPESVPSAKAAAPRGSLARPRTRSCMAAASLILGLLPLLPVARFLTLVFRTVSATLSLSVYYSDFAAALLAIILGHQAKAAIRRSGGHLHGTGMAVGGLFSGYLWLASSILVIAISAFVANSRIAANQASSLGSLRTINTAAISFAQTYHRGYPPSLAALGPPKAESPNASVGPSEKAADLIDEYLAAGRKSNYRFTYIAGPADSTGRIQTYAVHADPIEPGKTGKWYYFTDQTNVIRSEKGKEANESSPSIAGP